MMKIDAAKKVLQGGLLFLPMKNGLPKRVHYKSGVYVTCNEASQFKTYLPFKATAFYAATPLTNYFLSL